jgi:hypothetical protein
MDSPSVKMNWSGCNEIRNMPSVQQELLRRAQAIASACASGFGCVCDADVQPGQTRAHAMVKTTDAQSAQANAETNALLKSLDAGR